MAVWLAETVSVTVTDPPLASVTFRLLKVALRSEKNPRVESVTVPLNPLKLVTVNVDCTDPPGLTCRVNGGLNESEKSGAVTLTKTLVNLVRLPRVPSMVR
jgi:hypothetical protein